MDRDAGAEADRPGPAGSGRWRTTWGTTWADPLGHTQSYDYDADDRLMDHVDAAGGEEFFQYDIANQLVEDVERLHQSFEDVRRQSVLTDQRGGDRLVTYDDLGRATMEADPAGNVVAAAFDGSLTDSTRPSASYV